MATYLVLLQKGAPRNSDRAVFIADQFAWVAFLFPAFWLLAKRLWLPGIAVFLCQGLITIGSGMPGAALAGLLAELALRLLVALEGPAFHARRLEARGHTLEAIIPAPDLATAEEIYGAAVDQPVQNVSEPLMKLSLNAASSRRASGPSLGLFDSYGSR